MRDEEGTATHGTTVSRTPWSLMPHSNKANDPGTPLRIVSLRNACVLIATSPDIWPETADSLKRTRNASSRERGDK